MAHQLTRLPKVAWGVEAPHNLRAIIVLYARTYIIIIDNIIAIFENHHQSTHNRAHVTAIITASTIIEYRNANMWPLEKSAHSIWKWHGGNCREIPGSTALSKGSTAENESTIFNQCIIKNVNNIRAGNSYFKIRKKAVEARQPLSGARISRASASLSRPSALSYRARE